MKPILIIYDKNSLRSCNLLDMVIAGILQTYENCVFAKRNRNAVTITNKSNKAISCIIHKNTVGNIINRFAFNETMVINSTDNLLQTIHAPQQIFILGESEYPIMSIDFDAFNLISII